MCLKIYIDAEGCICDLDAMLPILLLVVVLKW